MLKNITAVLGLVIVAVGGALIIQNSGQSVSQISPSTQLAQVSSTKFSLGNSVVVVAAASVRSTPTSVTRSNITSTQVVNATGTISTPPTGSNPTYADGVWWWYVNYGTTSGWTTEDRIQKVNTSTPDVTPPSVPTGLTGSAVSTTQINLSWTASTDPTLSTGAANSGLAGYKIYRNGAQVGISATNSYSDTNLSASTAYSYTVSSYDVAGNTSTQSSTVSVTTKSNSVIGKFNIGDGVKVVTTIAVRSSPTSAPITPNKIGAEAVNATGTVQVGASYSNPTSADGLIWSYIRYADGLVGWSTESYLTSYTTPPPPTTYTVSPIKAGNGSGAITCSPASCSTTTGSSIILTATVGSNSTFAGWSGACSGTSLTCTVTSSAAVTATFNVVDTMAPTAPTNLQATVVSSSQINLSWTASTDDVGVKGYYVYRDGSNIANVTGGTTFANTSVSPNTTYSYRVSAYDVAGNSSAQSTAVSATTSAVSSSVAFPVRYSANSRYLVDINGNPFPILGRTSWFITSNTAADYQYYLDDTAAKGYDAIEFHVLSHDPRGNDEPYAGTAPTHSLPFVKTLNGANWTGNITYSNIATGAPDFTQPNEAYWAHVDAILAYAESKNILVFMFPAYVGYNGGEQGWMQELLANGPTKTQAYGAWIANRYKNQKNLVWMMGGDKGTSPLAFNAAETAVEQALYNGINSVSGKQSIYYSAEWQSESVGTDQAALGSAMTLNSVYSWSGDVSTQARRAYSYSGSTRPSYLMEEPYDQEGPESTALRNPDGTVINPSSIQPTRRFQWTGWLGTIGGYIAGNGFVWQFNPGWKNHLNTQGAQDMARLNTFIKSIPWYNLVPSGLSGMKTLVTGGQGTSNSLGGTNSNYTYVAAAATPTGDLLVAYIPPAHTGSITIDMTAMKGTTRARWFDPTTGTYTSTISTSLPNTGTRAFTPTGNNSVGQADWVLVLDTPGL